MLKKKWIWKLWMLIPLWVLYSWLSGPSGLWNQYRLHQENQTHTQTIDSLESVKVNLDIERARLRSDTLYLEKIIRKELGMARKEEQVYVLYSKE